MMRYGNMHLILLDFGDSGMPFMEGPPMAIDPDKCVCLCALCVCVKVKA